MLNFVGLIGTNSKGSNNRRLLQFMQKHFADKASIELVEIDNIPLFNKPAKMKVPEVVSELAKKIEAADGVIIATPEYDHSIPAVLQNALAWLSYGIFPMVNKPVMIVGASLGTLGSSRAQLQLRQILDAPELKAAIMPGSEFLLGRAQQAFDEKGNLKDKATVKKLDLLFDDFRLFVKLNEKMAASRELLRKEAENFDWENL